MSEKKEQKKQKKKKKRGHALYAFVVLTLGVIIIVLSFLLLFHVQTIEVAGNEHISTTEIAETIQSDKYSSNSLYVLAKSRLGRITYPKAAESVTIHMAAPWKLKVTVKEKKIIASVLVNDEYVFFNEEGLVISKSMVMTDEVPFIEGTLAPEASVNEILPVQEKRVFRNIKDALKAFENCGVTPARIVSQGANLSIYLDRVCVELGSGDMELKIMQIPPIMEKLEGKEGTLDLKHYNETTEIITFKEKTEKDTEKDGEKDPGEGEQSEVDKEEIAEDENV